MENPLSEYFKSINIAPNLDKTKLTRIGSDVIERYEQDESDREDWLKNNEKAIKLASQHSKGAKWAGEDAFDVMYPLISTASIQFAARAYPNIIKSADVVKTSSPATKTDEIIERGERVSRFMNFQLLNKIPSWPDEMDQLLHILPVIGCHFKKTYYGTNGAISENVPASDLVIPYFAKSLRDAPQITQIITLTQNDVIERQRTGVYVDTVAVEDLGFAQDEKDEQVFLEQHTWIDLDEDGYKEPYIVVVHRETQDVMRITARFNPDSVKYNEKGEVYHIEPVNHYTRYLFMPAFDGCVYGMGFGRLLGPINTTINSTINQLLDSGALYSRQGGFIGKDVRLGKNQSMYFKVGEWKHTSYRGDDLRKNIVPLPTHEPSGVLFSLLNLMIDAGKEMASVSELLSGEQRQSNVPAATTLALIEQGLKVFSGIYKRIYRSLKAEIDKIRAINKIYLDPAEYAAVINIEADPRIDFSAEDFDVIPVVDDTEITEIQRLQKAKALMELRGQGLNDTEILRRYMQALDINNIDEIIPQEQEPSPQEQAELDLTIAKAENERSQAKLYIEKINTEIVEQNVSQAGVALDRRKLKMEEARTAKELVHGPDDKGPRQEKRIEEMTPASNRRDQKQAYREVGMKSDNVRRRENA